MRTIIFTMITLVEILLLGRALVQLLECFLSPVRHRSLLFLLWPTLGIAATIPIQKIYLTNIWILLALFSAAVFIGFHSTFFTKVSVILMLMPTMIALGLFVDFFSGGQAYYYAVSTLFLILFWSTLGYFSKKGIPSVKLYFTNQIMLLADCVCVAPLIAVIFVASTTQEQVVPTLMIAFSCIATNIGVLLLMAYLGASAKTRFEIESYQLRHDYYASLEDHQTELLKIQHDTKHHIQMMEDLIRSDKEAQALEYIQKIKTATRKDHPFKRFCNHTLVNSLLNRKYQQIIDDSIQAEIQVSLEENLLIDDVDLCAVFSNTIDNAIEACEKIAKDSPKKISLKARVHNGIFSYQISNSLQKSHLRQNPDGTLKTTKKNSARHGFGLLNVKTLVENYDGNLDITVNNDIFELTIVIPVAKS